MSDAGLEAEVRRLRDANAQLEREADWLAAKCAQACSFTSNETCAWAVKQMVCKNCALSFCRSTREDWRRKAQEVVRMEMQKCLNT